MAIGTRARFQPLEGEPSPSLTASPDSTTDRAQVSALVVRITNTREVITMATRKPTFHVAPPARTRPVLRSSFVVRWAVLWACILSLVLIAPPASAGPLPNADDGGSGSAASGPRQTVSRLFNEVFTQQKGEVCTELMTAAAAHQTPGGDYQGPEGFTAFAVTIWTAFPDAVFVLDSVSETPDTVAVRWSMTGTHLGPLDGQKATGNRVELHGLAQFAFDGDRIAASWIEYDRLGLVDQIAAPVTLPPTCAECEDLPL